MVEPVRCGNSKQFHPMSLASAAGIRCGKTLSKETFRTSMDCNCFDEGSKVNWFLQPSVYVEAVCVLSQVRLLYFLVAY